MAIPDHPNWGKRGVPFAKGVSGNPGGRCKAAAAMAKLIAKETRNGVELVEMALEVARDVEGRLEDPRSWQYAHTWLTERVAGKAPQVIELGQADTSPEQQQDMLRKAIEVLGDKDRADLERILKTLEMAKVAGLLDVPEPEPG